MRTIEQTFQQLTALISDQTRDLALAMAELASVAQQRDVQRAERDNARQSLRAAEQDVAETESVNSDLSRAFARVKEMLAAAMERADTAEAILRAKA